MTLIDIKDGDNYLNNVQKNSKNKYKKIIVALIIKDFEW